MDTTIGGNMTTIPESLARLEQKIDDLDGKVDDMNKRLYGNGHSGIIVDQVKQDEQISKLMVIAVKNEGNIAKLTELATPTWLSKNIAKIAIFATLFFVIVHSLLPEQFTIWQLLALIK
jgi:hypothetical protein